MTVYLDLVMGLDFLVDFLLLLGANRLSGQGYGAKRCALAAGLGAIYAGACFLPGFAFLGNLLWRLVSLAAMGVLAYGVSREAAARTVLFVLLSMALGGIALGLGNGGGGGLLLAAAGLWLLCALGFQNAPGSRRYLPLELTYGGRRLRLQALVDTGNALRDPISGEPVTVVGPKTAQLLTGLTDRQLRTPVETLAAGTVPGLRLIPYKTVGRAGAMMLALRMEDVKIGTKRAGTLVAFAPEGLEDCQALVSAVG